MHANEMQTAADQVEPEQWVDRYGNYMYRFALKRISDPEVAKELVQEAIVSAFQAYKNFKGRSSVKTWLVAILKRKIVDYFRRMTTQRAVEDIEALADEVEDKFDDKGHWRLMPSPWTVNPSEVYDQKEFMDVLYQCLAKLPKRLAELFMLREFDGLSTKAICQQLDISESNSWVMLYRARMRLRECLEVNWLGAAK